MWSIESTHVGIIQCKLCPKHGKVLFRCRLLLGTHQILASEHESGQIPNSPIPLQFLMDSAPTPQDVARLILLGRRFSHQLGQNTLTLRNPIRPFHLPSLTHVLRFQETLEIVQVELVHFTPPDAVPKPDHQHNHTWGVKSECKHHPPNMLGS